MISTLAEQRLDGLDCPSETVDGLSQSESRKKESREMAARLKEKYHKEIKQALQKELGLENPMAVPKLKRS